MEKKELFRIISSGKSAKGINRSKVLAALASLFNATEEKVRPLLGGKPVIIKRGLDEPTLKRMLPALRKAGLICTAEPEEAKEPAAQEAPRAAARQPQRPRIKAPDTGAAIKARTLDPEPGQASAVYAALLCNEITPSGPGLDFHRPGARDVSFEKVRLISLYSMHLPEGPSKRAMIFTSVSRRPFVINADNIKFWGFEGISADSVNDSLRQFVALVHKANPELMLDTPTVSFMGGKDLERVRLDESITSAAFGKAIEATGGFEPAEAGAPDAGEEPIDISHTLDALRMATEEPVDTADRARSRARIAMGAAGLSAIMVMASMYGQLSFLKDFHYFFRGKRFIINNLIMWPSLMVMIFLISLAALSIVRIWRRSKKAIETTATFGVLLVLLSMMRFLLVVVVLMGLRHGFISWLPPLHEVQWIARGDWPILKSFVLSMAGPSLPLAWVMVKLFASSPEARWEFLY